MIHQPQLLSSLARNTIIQSLENFIIKNSQLPISTETINTIINQAIRTLGSKSITAKIWNQVKCTEVYVQTTVSSENMQILCTLWRKTIKIFSITSGNFEKTTFTDDSFEQLRIVKIERPKHMCTTQLHNLCRLLPNNLEECTITYCDALDDETLETLITKCQNLKLLNIAGCRNISVIKPTLKKLVLLDISGTKINDQVFSDIEKESLISLNCSNTSISNIGLKIIETISSKNLRNLDIQYCPKITHLGDGFANLVTLGTYNTSIPIESCPDIMLQLPNAHGRPLLHHAIILKNQTLISNILEKILGDKKSHILQLQDSQGNLALHLACQTEQEDLALALINNMDQKTLEVQGALKKTALHFASQKGLSKIALVLIKKISPCVLAIQDVYGNTALYLACQTRQEDLALELINNMDQKTLGLQGADKKTALHWAIEQQLHKVSLQLLEKMCIHNLSTQDIYGNTALHLACQTEQEDLALELINNMDQKTLGLQGADKKTALHWAIEQQLHKVTLQLLEKMFIRDLSIQNKCGNTALHLACSRKQEDLAFKLLENVDQKALGLQGTDKKTPLQCAISIGFFALAFSLIEKTSSHALAAQDIVGNTALHYACRMKHEILALQLIEKMNPEALKLQGAYKQTALDLAIEHELEKVISSLEKHLDV